mmetsp:Transcript_40187/g.126463  ORF Transcript_40187/g.126463 Transcript_40187/m.126463 type:complete len:223 (+) Transcript_40187:322-990(+)
MLPVLDLNSLSMRVFLPALPVRRLVEQDLRQELLAGPPRLDQVQAGVGLSHLHGSAGRSVGTAVVLLIDKVAVAAEVQVRILQQVNVHVDEEDADAAVQQLPHQLHRPPHDPEEVGAHELSLGRDLCMLEERIRLYLPMLPLHPPRDFWVRQPNEELEAQPLSVAHPVAKQLPVARVADDQDQSALVVGRGGGGRLQQCRLGSGREAGQAAVMASWRAFMSA